ncbi:MAG TPA: hypothetical protein VGK58_11365, partial [Lacipirellulaceae bacterium]
MATCRSFLAAVVLLALAASPSVAQSQTTRASYTWFEGFETHEDVDFNQGPSSSVSLMEEQEREIMGGTHTYGVDLEATAVAGLASVSANVSSETSSAFVDGEIEDGASLISGTARVSAEATASGAYSVTGPWDPGTAVLQQVFVSLAAGTNSTHQESTTLSGPECPCYILYSLVNGHGSVGGHSFNMSYNSQFQDSLPQEFLVQTTIGADL